MNAPHVRNTWHDAVQGVKYHVVAYRTLSPFETRNAVREYLKQQHDRHPRRGQEVTIVTLLGLN